MTALEIEHHLTRLVLIHVVQHQRQSLCVFDTLHPVSPRFRCRERPVDGAHLNLDECPTLFQIEFLEHPAYGVRKSFIRDCKAGEIILLEHACVRAGQPVRHSPS